MAIFKVVTLFMVLRQRRSKHFPFNRAKSQNYIVSLHPERVVKSHGHSYCPCIRAPAVLLLKTKLTRFCLVSRIWKIQTMYTRRGTTVHVYTWACRLIVYLHGNPEPESLDVGYAGPRSLYPYSISKCQPEYTHRCLSKGNIDTRPFFLKKTVVLKIGNEVAICEDRHFYYYFASGISLHFVV